MRTLLSVALAVIAAVVLTGCGSGDPYGDLREEMEKIKRQPRGSIKPPPEFKTYKNFVYSAALLRSPFQPPVEVAPVSVVASGKRVTPDFNRTPEQLEEFSIEALAMVGTINKPGDELEALIRDNRARIHRVVVGNYLGKNHGKVLGITANKIDVLELVPDGQDGWVERPRSMVLRSN